MSVTIKQEEEATTAVLRHHWPESEMVKDKRRGWSIKIPCKAGGGALEINLFLSIGMCDDDGAGLGFTLEEAKAVCDGLGLKCESEKDEEEKPTEEKKA